jgi:hypothetical protein
MLTNEAADIASAASSTAAGQTTRSRAPGQTEQGAYQNSDRNARGQAGRHEVRNQQTGARVRASPQRRRQLHQSGNFEQEGDGECGETRAPQHTRQVLLIVLIPVAPRLARSEDAAQQKHFRECEIADEQRPSAFPRPRLANGLRVLDVQIGDDRVDQSLHRRRAAHACGERVQSRARPSRCRGSAAHARITHCANLGEKCCAAAVHAASTRRPSAVGS